VSNQNKEAVLALMLIGLVLCLLVVGPFFTIWSLNTLFGLQIPYSFTSWAAVVWLLTALHGIKISLNKSN
jgi:cobalamin biosynthesis protein CobD/CbiB